MRYRQRVASGLRLHDGRVQQHHRGHASDELVCCLQAFHALLLRIVDDLVAQPLEVLCIAGTWAALSVLWHQQRARLGRRKGRNSNAEGWFKTDVQRINLTLRAERADRKAWAQGLHMACVWQQLHVHPENFMSTISLCLHNTGDGPNKTNPSIQLHLARIPLLLLDAALCSVLYRRLSPPEAPSILLHNTRNYPCPCHPGTAIWMVPNCPVPPSLPQGSPHNTQTHIHTAAAVLRTEQDSVGFRAPWQLIQVNRFLVFYALHAFYHAMQADLPLRYVLLACLQHAVSLLLTPADTPAAAWTSAAP